MESRAKSSQSTTASSLAKDEISKKEVILREAIGEGGFSTIYRGLWLNKEVALKKITFVPHEGADENEINILKKLASGNSPDVIGYFGCYKNNASSYTLVMECANKDSLFAWINNDERDAPALSLRYQFALAAVRAIAYIHAQGVIHRDLKPDNLLLTRGNQVKLADYGLSIFSYQATKSRTIVGTAGYIAPEGYKPIFSDKLDIYALAITLWEILAWKEAYKNLTPQAAMHCTLRNIREEIPAEIHSPIANIIASGWNGDFTQRPSAEKMRKDFDEFLQSETGKPFALKR